MVSICLICSFLINPNVIIFFEFSLATTITVLKSVACDHVTSFNYDGKKARDVGVTFWCHMSNIVPDSMLHESMRQGINVLFFCFVLVLYLFFLFFARWYICFPYDERQGISFIDIKSVGVGEFEAITDLGRWDWLAFSEIRSLKHVSGFQSFIFIWCVVIKQGCCVFIQYNLLKVVANGF